MATRDTIVIGASAGGVSALSALVTSLPANLPAAVLIVLHIPADSPSLLPTILARDSALPVAHATHGEPILPGRIYVAPPDRHLLIDQDRIKLVHGPKDQAPAGHSRNRVRSGDRNVIGLRLSEIFFRSRYGPARQAAQNGCS